MLQTYDFQNVNIVGSSFCHFSELYMTGNIIVVFCHHNGSINENI